MPDTKPERLGYEGTQQAAQLALGEDLWEFHAAARKLLDLTAGIHQQDFENSELLQAFAASMLQILRDALTRIAAQSAEQAIRLEASSLPQSQTDIAQIFTFLQTALPNLTATAQVELERWHEGEPTKPHPESPEDPRPQKSFNRREANPEDENQAPPNWDA